MPLLTPPDSACSVCRCDNSPVSQGERIFSEKQASDILQRAARLQEERGDPTDPYAPGLRQEDLAKIAAEAGIDPKYLEAAIREAQQQKEDRRFFNLSEEQERIVEGELDPAEFDVIFEVAKPARTRRHPPTQVGRTLTMRTSYKGSLYHVEVSSRNGRTRVRVRSLPFFAYLMSLHPAILLSFFGAGNLGAHGQLTSAVLFVLVCMIAGAGAFLGLVRRAKSKSGELADLIEDRIVEANKDLRTRLSSPSTQGSTSELHQRT